MLLLTGLLTNQSKVVPQGHEPARGKSCLRAWVHRDQTHCFREGRAHSSQIPAQWGVIVSVQTPQPDIIGRFLSQRRIAAVSLWWVPQTARGRQPAWSVPPLRWTPGRWAPRRMAPLRRKETQLTQELLCVILCCWLPF